MKSILLQSSFFFLMAKQGPPGLSTIPETSGAHTESQGRTGVPEGGRGCGRVVDGQAGLSVVKEDGRGRLWGTRLPRLRAVLTSFERY